MRQMGGFSRISRRRFLKLAGVAGLTWLISSCSPDLGPEATPTSTATASITPSPVPTASPTSAPMSSYRSMAAIGRASAYDVPALRHELARMLDGIGGLGDLVRPGAHVGIKPNLTGETWWDASLPVPATELFATHPALVEALAGLLMDAGAGKVTVLEGLGDTAIFPRWGYTELAGRLGADLVDLCTPKPFYSWKLYPVGSGFSVYENFYLNPILSELDVFVSVGKMKCHATTGVTLSLKNLFGIAPISLYRRHPGDNNRSFFHDTAAFDRRVPRVILDLNLARPVHLAVIDGVMTSEGGAGPWDAGLSQVKPGVLVASRDPLAADAVATAVMGFDPEAAPGVVPFTGGDNHLSLAAAAGLGTLRIGDIGIAGPSIEEVRFPFKPVG